MGKQRSIFRMPRPGGAIYEAADDAVKKLAKEFLRDIDGKDNEDYEEFGAQVEKIYGAAASLSRHSSIGDPEWKEFTTPPDPSSLVKAWRRQREEAEAKDPRGQTHEHQPRTKILNKHGDVIGYQNTDGNGGTIK